jgi:pilus assembly protein CpaB
MRAKSIVLLLIAGVCGLVASIGISQVIERKGESTDTPMGELFVAITDIDINGKLDATNVKLDKWPKDRIPEGAIRKLEDLKDKFPRVRLYAGEPILQAKLMDSTSGVDQSAKIPEGYRVVSVKVTMDEVVSGLVQPGDRVDVIFFGKKSEEIAKTIAHTILKDVRVFAVNSETERSTDTNGEQIAAKTVSLLVKPNQVESVMLAAELGKLRLSLRRANDAKTDESEDGTDIEALLGDTKRRIEESKAKPADALSGIYDLLNKQPTAAPQPTVMEAPVEQKPQWRMTILSPGGSQEFEWTDVKGLPQPASGNGSTGAASAATLPLAPVPGISPEPAIDETLNGNDGNADTANSNG